MAAVPKLEVSIARKFQPFEALSDDKVKEIIEKSAIQKLPAGRYLFKQGDKDNWSIFLISGTVELQQADGSTLPIQADTASAKHAISNLIPRLASARSKTKITILVIDRGLLELLLDWHSSSSIHVSDLDEDDDDWMTRFLQSNAFMQLPPANIQALMMRLEEQSLNKGDVIFEENSLTDNKFYIIQEGTCKVSKTNTTSGTEITLAQLRHGDSFGEEALITGGIRGARVTMQTDGVISSLNKRDFIELLVSPLIQRIKINAVNKLIPSEEYELIDVRNEDEFTQNQLENTLHNIPISQIRAQLDKLSPDKHYILYSNNENRSSTAAFLLIKQGYECSILEDGINDIETSLDERIETSLDVADEINTHYIEDSTNSDNNELNLLASHEYPDTLDQTEFSSEISDKNETDNIVSEQLLVNENKYKEILKNTTQYYQNQIQKKSDEILQAVEKSEAKTKQVQIAKNDIAQLNKELKAAKNESKQQIKISSTLKKQVGSIEEELKQLKDDSKNQQETLIHQADEELLKEKNNVKQSTIEQQRVLDKVDKLKQKLIETRQKSTEDIEELKRKYKQEIKDNTSKQHKEFESTSKLQKSSFKEKTDSLQADIKEYKQQSLADEQRQKESENEIQKLKNQIENYKSSSNENEESFSKQLNEQQDKINQADKQILDIEAARDKYESELQQSHIEIKELRTQSTAESQSLADEVEQIKDQNLAQTDEIEELKQQLTTSKQQATEEIDTLKIIQNQSLEDSTSKLHDEFKALSKTQETNHQEKINSLQADIEQYKQQTLTDEQLQKESENEIEELKNQIENNQSSYNEKEDDFSEQLNQAQEKINQDDKQILDIEAARDKYESELQKSHIEIEELRTQSTAESQSLADEVQQIKAQNSANIDEIEELKQQLTTSKLQATEEIKTLKSMQNQSLEDSTSKLYDEFETLSKTQKTTHQEKIDSLQADIEEYKQQSLADEQLQKESANKILDFKNQIENYESSYNENEKRLSEQLNEAQDKIYQADKQILDIEAARDKYESELQQSHVEIKELRTQSTVENQSLETEVQQFKHQNLTKTDEIEELKQQLTLSKQQSIDDIEKLKQGLKQELKQALKEETQNQQQLSKVQQSTLQDKINSALSEIEQYKTEIEQYKKQSSKNEQDHQYSEDKITNLISKLESKKSEYKDNQKRLSSELKETQKDSQEEIQRLNKIIENHNLDDDEQEKIRFEELTSAQHEVIQANKTISKIETAHQELQAEMKQIQHDIKADKTKIKTLQKEIADNVNKQKESSNHSLEQKQEQQQEKDELKQKITHELQQHKQDNIENQQEIKELNEKISTFKQQNHKDIEQLKEEKEILENEKQALNLQLIEAEKKLLENKSSIKEDKEPNKAVKAGNKKMKKVPPVLQPISASEVEDDGELTIDYDLLKKKI